MPASLLPAKRQVPSARPHHSPEGGQPPRYAAPLVLLLEVVADYKRLSAVQGAGRAGDLRASGPQYSGLNIGGLDDRSHSRRP
jgi:hypothetical protein